MRHRNKRSLALFFSVTHVRGDIEQPKRNCKRTKELPFRHTTVSVRNNTVVICELLIYPDTLNVILELCSPPSLEERVPQKLRPSAARRQMNGKFRIPYACRNSNQLRRRCCAQGGLGVRLWASYWCLCGYVLPLGIEHWTERDLLRTTPNNGENSQMEIAT